MGKHVRLPSPTRADERPAASKPGQRSAAKLAEGAPPDPRSLFDRTVTYLEQLLTSCEAALKSGEGNSALVRESAGLARAITTMSAEQRAREKAAERAELQATKGMTVPNVLTFVRRLDPDQRRTVLRELQRIDAEKTKSSVLG